jgi:hypothetical protein
MSYFDKSKAKFIGVGTSNLSWNMKAWHMAVFN